MAKDPNELINELNKNINSVNNMPEGLGGQINYDLRDAPFQGATQVAHQQTQADLFALQEKRRLQALDAQRKSALANLARERGQVDPAFNTALSNVAGTSARQARNFAEYLAQRGQTQSGIAAQGEMQRHSDLLSQQGQLEQQRTDWLADLGMRESEVRNAYEQSVIDAAMEREYNQLNFLLQDRDRQRQEDIATVGQYGADYARKLNEIEAMEARGDFSQSHLKPYLLMGRQEKLGAIQQAESLAAQQEFENWIKEQQLRISREKLDIDRLRAMNVGRGGGGGGGGSGGGKPKLTAPQARDAMNNGNYTQAVVDAYNYWYGTNYTVEELTKKNLGLPSDFMGGMGADIIQAQMNKQITPEEGHFLRMLDMQSRLFK